MASSGKFGHKRDSAHVKLRHLGGYHRPNCFFLVYFVAADWAIVQPILHLGSEPCALAFRKLSCGNCGGLASVFQCHLSLKVCATSSGAPIARFESSVGSQFSKFFLGFFQCACVQHDVEPLRNPCHLANLFPHQKESVHCLSGITEAQAFHLARRGFLFPVARCTSHARCTRMGFIKSIEVCVRSSISGINASNPRSATIASASAIEYWVGLQEFRPIPVLGQ